MTRGLEKLIVECPFCKKKTITVLHQPFVARKSLSKSRFGTGVPYFPLTFKGDVDFTSGLILSYKGRFVK